MFVNNINNSAAQLQLYANEKAAATTPLQSPNAIAATPSAQLDDVIISEQARALFSNSAQGNGAGIEPPKIAAANKSEPVYTTLGNGAGIEPPKTGAANKSEPVYSTLGNGAGIEPPKP
ncbi:hypothetical protein [Rheinheimera maricola]|uniref:Uncharacterized protein n=1 Tax=Rheinheimera maricola TaxID=2793282 RepID=A0ABS7XAT2_9GAMM|nr:hypothetical protein [Rheinheimera maricola]MBZ9612671.1 hypothetical protein [Rheinheimera maricola]